MTRLANRLSVSTVALAALLVAAPAFAAEEVVAEADATAAESDSGLVEIVVTATKRETKLQETPIAIAVMGD